MALTCNNNKIFKQPCSKVHIRIQALVLKSILKLECVSIFLHKITIFLRKIKMSSQTKRVRHFQKQQQKSNMAERTLKSD